MAELTTIARPYAEALFRLARETGSLAAWLETLTNLASIAENPEAQEVVANPRYTAEQKQALLLELLGGESRPEVVNFVAMVLQNRRFVALPTVALMFEELKAASEGQVEARIETAFALTDAQLNALTATLSQQFNRKVHAEVSVNSALIGGAKVTIGDLVVDASVRGKLSALAASLKS
ncbi:MAG: synthase subunit delta [Proteobacteria bacterium]|nr:synthase subunit delta [Pseudomonadota bacterium]